MSAPRFVTLLKQHPLLLILTETYECQGVNVVVAASLFWRGVNMQSVHGKLFVIHSLTKNKQA